MNNDAIAAIATPVGESAIGIVRISGPDAVKIAEKVLKTKDNASGKWENRRMNYGYVRSGDTGEIIDEALFCYMAAPRSYTREDVVEINCHGGIVPLKKTLELVLASGARLAEPGEFTKRAFLNGRLDLAQAEAVIDLIRIKTDKGLNMALSQLKGELSGKINTLNDNLLDLLAKIEAENDFPDEQHSGDLNQEILKTGAALLRDLESLIEGARTGIIFREGIRAAIIGRPNVGKSSLLNALLKQNRAIVTNVPGTTRDVIEETANIKGVPVCLMDTAGVRETSDIVEIIGVQRTKEVIDQVDLVLAVFDGSSPLSSEDRVILKIIEDKKHIQIINKTDLGLSDGFVTKFEKNRTQAAAIQLSIKTGEGLDRLEESIAEAVFNGVDGNATDILVTNIRHKAALEKAAVHLKEALEGLKNGVPIDITAIDLREAWEKLGEITGAVVTEDLLERIFRDFCVGK